MVNITAMVLNHATPSFDAATKTSTMTLDFGIVPFGGASGIRAFSVANLQSTALTAGLDLTGVNISGSTAFSTDVAAFQNEAAGTSHAFDAFLNTSAVGAFSATGTIGVSDDRTLAGAVASNLTLQLSGTVAYLGDATLDGHVDGADLAVVLGNFGKASGGWTAGNFDGAATVDLTDLAYVLNNFGIGGTGGAGGSAEGAATVPEASTLGVMGVGLVGLLRRRR